MSRTFMREKRIYCGEKYQEVDIYPYTEMQKNRVKGKRGKKIKVSEPKQRDLNDKNARRYLIQLGNTNFTEKDLHVSVTYTEDNLPKTVEEAEREITNYLRRIQYKRKKQGLGSLKYILVTSYGKKENGKMTRIHHHIIMNGGLNRNEVEDLWRKRRRKGQKEGEKRGYINADRLQPDGSGIAALCHYLSKNPTRKKRWSCSHNLKRPQYTVNDNKYTKRQVEKLCKGSVHVEYWERKYPGWTIANKDYGMEIIYNELSGWAIYLKLKRKM